MLSTVQDVVFAVRHFRRSIGFSITVVLTLGLGIGATTAIFSLVDGILLRPLPFPESERLVTIDTLEFSPRVSPANLQAADDIGDSYPNFFDWQRQNHSFDSLASYDPVQRLISKPNGEGARVEVGARISANLFSTLGVAPALGRSLTRDEEQPGHRVVILSHELWVSDFKASPNAIGQILKISDEPSTIVGVMPNGFHFPIGNPAKFWATFAADAEGPAPNTSNRAWDRVSVIGRLKSGIAIQQGIADLTAIQRALAQHYSEDRFRSAVTATPLLDAMVDDVRPSLVLLLAAVGFVLLIACANVAGLLLGRAAARSPELALRAALGATRARVLTQLLVEALLLASVGAALGIPLAVALLRIGLRYVPNILPRMYNVTINSQVLAFAVLLSAITALIFGLLPAWKMSGTDPADALRDGAHSTTPGRRRNRLHHALVVVETALGFTLLIGSGLLIRSAINVLVIDPGFDTKNSITFDIALTQKRYPDPLKVPFFDKLLPQLATLPGVEKVSAGHPLPIYWPKSSWASFTIVGRPHSPDDLPGAITAAVEPGYFETLSIPLLRGRTFSQHDNDPKSTLVAVIDRSFAQRYFPGQDPIGQHFIPNFGRAGEADVPRQIVGIVGDIRSGDSWHPYQPEFYLPYAQDAAHQRPLVVMKVKGGPYSYQNAIRRVVAGIDKDTPVFRYRTFTDDTEGQAAQPRFEAALLSSFATIALLLSAVGLYSVLSFVVAQRTRELGLRMALGASPSSVLHLVLRRALALACCGIALGVATSIVGTRLIAGSLFKVSPVDPLVFTAVALVLITVSTIAALTPALRAAKLDPMRTLRDQ